VVIANPRYSAGSLSSLRRLNLHDRANSDTNLAHSSLHRRSMLTVDRHDYTLGLGDSISVSWDIKEDCGATDWIGLFLYGESNASNYLDQKSRGLNGSNKGEVAWCIDDAEHNFTESSTKLHFRYYHGTSGALRAATTAITVKNTSVERIDEESDQESSSLEFDLVTGHVRARGRQTAEPGQLVHFTVSEMNAKYLKKGMFFNPDPYVKMSIQPGKRSSFPRLSHHGQPRRSSIQQNTTNPMWASEEFTFEALPTDVIEFEVKDKFAKSRPTISRFLGKLTVPVQRLIDRAHTSNGATTLTFNLMRRNPSDNVSGLLVFTVDVERQSSGNSTESPRSGRRKNRQHSHRGLEAMSGSPSNSPRRRRKHRHSEGGVVVANGHVNNIDGVLAQR
jgi:E3 ubiquitin-protein ligase HECW2